MKPGTYVEAQYSTASAREMIRGWLGSNPTDYDIERVARYMRTTLRIGGLMITRELVRAALEAHPNA